MNKEADIPGWMTRVKTTLIQKENEPPKEPPQQLQTHNVLTYDVDNTKSTNKGRDLQLANKP